jgi:hypothetical protein
MTTSLSSAAQAVLDSMYEVNLDFNEENHALAAAILRAAADQLKAPVDLGLYGNSYWAGMSAAETQLRAIAAELEA